MAALGSYVDRMPALCRQRYQARYWVAWANSLLERLSGVGWMPPQLLTRGVTVHDEVWIERPLGSRDIKELRSSECQKYKYRFAEENNKLRLMDVRMPEVKRLVLPVLSGSEHGILVESPQLWENQLKNMLFVVAQGSAAGRTFIVGGNEKANEVSGIAHVHFLHPASSTWSAPNGEFFSQTVTYDTGTTPTEQNTFSVGEGAYISLGYFVPQSGYLILAYIAAFVPVYSLADDLGINGYENLIDAWFRWKVEEQASAVSHECMYWQSRVQAELDHLRGERYNRMNKPVGRRLVGFENTRRRYA